MNPQNQNNHPQITAPLWLIHHPPRRSAGQAPLRVALYARFSREDGDRSECDSIDSQKKLLDAFLARQDCAVLAGFYIDDGYTGISFDRPAFRQMISDIEAGQINCVVVTDLTRFGRDYIGVEKYLCGCFPAHGVRFISLKDDDFNDASSWGILAPKSF